MLAEEPFISVVPLPMGLPSHEQAFFDCKSDVKAAEYGSHRIEGVYSPVPPYTESELPCCIAPANTAQAWKQSILTLSAKFPGGGNELAEHAAFRTRRPSVVASQLLTVLSGVAGAAARPIEFRPVPTPRLLRNIERGLRKLRSQVFR